MISFTMTITILGGLSLFLYGMKIMSEGLQKVAGNRLRSTLHAITSNRISGVFTGLFITAAIQSSSATTVMLVSFVNAGLINLTQSLGVIMGANIGTTVTGWLVAILGFKVNINLFALPAISVGFFVRFLNKQRLTDWGEVLLGFGLLFFGLTLMKDALGDLKNSPDIIRFMGTYRAADLWSTLAVVGAGTAVTMIIQSSSATMALTLTLASQGIIDYPTSAALVLGENIGTTITANLAAIGASTAARQCARAHMVFNVLGVIWMLFVFNPFLRLVDGIVPGNVFTTDTAALGSVLPGHLAAFHTLFNITNTLLFLPIMGLLGWAARMLVPDAKNTETARLTYISSALLSTPPLAIEESKRELALMAKRVIEMLDTVMELFNKQDKTQKDYYEFTQTISSLETLTDTLEQEISDFLVRIIRNQPSDEQSQEIVEILNAVSNLERIGDHCEILMKLLNRLHEKNLAFTEDAEAEINALAAKVRDMLLLIADNITLRKTNIMVRASSLEDIINKMRHNLRDGHIKRLNEGSCDVNQGLVFIDMLSSFEKIGDHAFNIAQSISGLR